MQKIIEFTKKIVACRSVFGDKEEISRCLDLIKGEFGTDFIVREYFLQDRPMLVLSNAEDKIVDLIFAGHIDVVQAEALLFSTIEQEEKLIGRGVFDMKGPLVATLYAVQKIVKKTKLKIAIFITSDEEVDGLSVDYLLNFGYRANFAILPDGGNDFSLVVGQNGLAQYKITFTGQSTHASSPWEGDNPFVAALNVCGRLQAEFPDPLNESDWKTSVSVTRIASGQTTNQIPAKLEMYLDIRFVDEKDLDKVLAIINYQTSVAFEAVVKNGGLKSDQNNHYVVELKKIMEKTLGKTVGYFRTAGTSDAIYFAQKNIPAVLFRPQGGNQHSDGEWVDKNSLVKFYNILVDYLEKLNHSTV